LLDDRKPQIKIQNVVASGDLGQGLDLDSILRAIPGAEYNPQEFPGLLYRLKRPRTATLLFGSGKMVCTGARSERSARRALTRIVNELRCNGIVIAGRLEIRIENIVASGDLGGTVDLEIMAECLPKTMYEPEQFPGLIYRMDEPKAVILIFSSGKLVCTGIRKEREVRTVVEKLYEILNSRGLIFHDSSQIRKELCEETFARVLTLQ
jgi:transcription initiation factor TFIID TATA-box-binding protein